MTTNSASSAHQFGIGLSSLYVKHHFDRESKKSAVNIVNYIKDEFIQILREVEWLDKPTADYAISKAKAIKAYIGYPDELLNDTLVEEFYKDVSQILRSDHYKFECSNGRSSLPSKAPIR